MDNGTKVTDRRADGLDEELGRAARKGMPMPPSIAKGLVKAMAAAKPVAKAGQYGDENSKFSYKYATSEDVIIEARDALSVGGVSVLTESWEVATRTVRYLERAEDGTVQYVEEDEDSVVVSYLLVSAEGDSWRPAPVRTPILPEKGRPPDKALATALTYNLNYYLRGLLLLARRMPQEKAVDERDDTQYQPKPRQRPAPKGKPQQPPAEQGPPTSPADVKLRFSPKAGLRFGDMTDEMLGWVRDQCQKHIAANRADEQAALAAVYRPHHEAAVCLLAEREAARAAQPPAAAPPASEPAPHQSDQGLEQGGCSAQEGDVP